MGSHETIRLSLLGTPRLEGASDGGAAVLSQQKRLALLAYLAVRHEFVRREDLVVLFWADSEERGSRAALSQGLHFLRRALGPNVIVNRGTEEIGLSPDVWCDTGAFEAALAERRLDDALVLYRGELLQGVNGGLSAEFSFWLDSERTRLHRLAAEAAATRSDQCFRAGDLSNAVQWQRRALELRSTDEVTLRNYLALLDEIGDGGTAVAAYEAFRERLEKAFQLEPSRETVRLVDQIRARRPETPALRPISRAVPAETIEPIDEPAVPSGDRASQTPGEERAPGHWFANALRPATRRVNLVVVTLLVAIGALAWGESMTRGSNSVPDPNRVAVMYLDVRGDSAELGYLADGITEELINNLTTIPTIQVISPNGVRRYRRKGFEPESLFARLNAGSLITGVVSGTKDRASVTLNIENRANVVLAPIEPIHRDFTVGDVLETIQKITEDIVAELGPVLNEAMTFDQMRAGTTNDAAWAHVAKARQKWGLFDQFMTRGPLRSAQQVALDADKLLVAAIELDRKWIAPHIIRGEFAVGMAWACLHNNECEAEPWLENAIGYANDAEKVLPGSSLALELRGRALYYQWIFGLADGDIGILNAAEQNLLSAADDQSRATALNLLSSIYLGRSEYVEADNAAEGALQADAFHEDRVEILFTRFRANFHLGNHIKAKQACEDLRGTRGNLAQWPAMFCWLALQAWSEDIRPDVSASLQILQTESVDPRIHRWLEIMVGAVLGRAGQTEQARLMIDQALAKASSANEEEAIHFGAAALTKLGDRDRAQALLDAYVAGKPAERVHVRKEFWFRDLKDPDNEVRQLRDPPR